MSQNRHNIIRELDDSIHNPRILYPEHPEIPYGSLHDCPILDTNTSSITNDDVLRFIDFMRQHNLELEFFNGKIRLDCEEYDLYKDNPADPSYKFNAYLYLCRRREDGTWMKTPMGFVYYYANLKSDGTYEVEEQYEFECCPEEYYREPGDYFKVGFEGFDDGIPCFKWNSVNTPYPEPYQIQFVAV
jgi:hypothetical protein